MGKSRLIAEFVRGVRAGGGLVAFGECQAFGTHADYFVWQEIWRTLLRVDSQQGDEEQRARARARARGDRPGLVQRAPLLGPVLGIADSGQRPHRRLRREAAQDLARGPARRVPAGAGDGGAGRDRARGLPLDRSAVARPADGARARVGGAARALRARLPAGGDARRRPRPRAAAPLRRDRARRARAGRRRAPDPLQAGAALRRRGDGLPTPRRARHRALAGQSLLRRGAAQLHPRPGHRSRRTTTPCAASSCRRACTA